MDGFLLVGLLVLGLVFLAFARYLNQPALGITIAGVLFLFAGIDLAANGFSNPALLSNTASMTELSTVVDFVNVNRSLCNVTGSYPDGALCLNVSSGVPLPGAVPVVEVTREPLLNKTVVSSVVSSQVVERSLYTAALGTLFLLLGGLFILSGTVTLKNGFD